MADGLEGGRSIPIRLSSKVGKDDLFMKLCWARYSVSSREIIKALHTFALEVTAVVQVCVPQGISLALGLAKLAYDVEPRGLRVAGVGSRGRLICCPAFGLSKSFVQHI